METNSNISNKISEPVSLRKITIPGQNEIVSQQEFRLRDGRRLELKVAFPKGTSAPEINSKMQEMANRIDSLPKNFESNIKKENFSDLVESHIWQPGHESEKVNAILSEVLSDIYGHSITISLERIKAETVIEPDKMQHLFRVESPKLFRSFINALVQRYPDKKEELTELKDERIDSFNEIFSAHPETLLSAEDAKKAWSTKEEKQRQKEATNLLSEGMYEALARVPEDPQVTKAELHKQIFQELAGQRKEEISKEGKIDFGYKFDVNTDAAQKITVDIKTVQFGDSYLSSIEKRDENSKGAVNSHVENVAFASADGSKIEASRLRTGAFDFFDISAAKLLPNEMLAKEVGQGELDEMTTRLDNAQSRKEFIANIRKGGTAKELFALSEVLKSDKASKGESEKCLEEAFVKYSNEKIEEVNLSRIKEVLQNPQSKDIGMTLPDSVKEAYNRSGNPILKGDKQGWGMISLQTPVNIVGGKGKINEFILKQAKNEKFPPFVRSAFQLLANQDISELDSISREMNAFKKAGKELPETECLYFNIPTNFFGQKRTIVNIGPHHINFRLNTMFNVGIVDQHRSKVIKDTTHESFKQIYETGMQASKALESELLSIKEEIVLKPQKRVELEKELNEIQRYKNSIDSLLEQTFDVSEVEKVLQQASGVSETIKVKIVKLKAEPNDSARYESVGRLTVLMEMLNMKTTGHCRSGNNRTAAWLAKSNQILGNIAASKNGKCPPPSETASFYKEGKKEHWSLPIFSGTFKSSLDLQKANKGIEGSKEKITEYKNPTFRRAVVAGAFDLAQKFDPTAYNKAARKLNKPSSQQTE